MDLHQFLTAAGSAGYLVTIDREVDPSLEMARLIAEHDGRPILFNQVKGSSYCVAAGVCSDRRYFGLALGVPADQVIFRLAEALAEPRPDPLTPFPAREGGIWLPSPGRGGVGGEVEPTPPAPLPAREGGDNLPSPARACPELVEGGGVGGEVAPAGEMVAPCREVIEPEVNLEAMPFLTHYAADAGPYASAAVAFINDPDTGPNASFHRLLRLDRTRVAIRLVEQRGTHTAWLKSPDDLPVAICIGLPLHVLLAAAMSPPPGVDELTIAQALTPTPVVVCSNGIRVPAEAEFVFEGRITHELVPEGPFVDLTGTYDFTRMQPVVVIDRISHRRDAIYQALLPGRLEHRLLMGMPREPTIYAEVNKVARCLNVHITPGGASWLHAVVQIAKRSPEDGRRAIAAAFRGHGSLKHVWVVDDDIDIFDPHDVEWAVATRFQADRDLVVLSDQLSSSLDPSAQHTPGQPAPVTLAGPGQASAKPVGPRKSRTAKMGLDATIHWETPEGPKDPQAYQRVKGHPLCKPTATQ